MARKREGRRFGLNLSKDARASVARQVTSKDGKPTSGVQSAIIRVLGVQRPVVLAYLRRLIRRHPDATPSQLAGYVERDYLRALTGTGAAGGAAAVVPGVGTVASLGLSAGIAVTFLEASALYAQSISELHGIAVQDPEKARDLVMAVLLGQEGLALLAGVSDQFVAGGKGASGVGNVLSTAAGKGSNWSVIGQELQTRFLRHFVKREAAGAVGRALPFGIGALVGGVTQRRLGRRVIASTMEAFGSLPAVHLSALEREVASAPSSAQAQQMYEADRDRAAQEVAEALEAERRRRRAQIPPGK